MTVTGIMFLQTASLAIMGTVSKVVTGEGYWIDMHNDTTAMLFYFAVIGGCCTIALFALSAIHPTKLLAIEVEPTPA